MVIFKRYFKDWSIGWCLRILQMLNIVYSMSKYDNGDWLNLQWGLGMGKLIHPYKRVECNYSYILRVSQTIFEVPWAHFTNMV